MALGAMPYNALETAQHLEQLITIIEDALKVSDRLNIAAPLRLLEKGALGGVYFTTELHLLTDSSQDYGDTWTFLDARVKDLEIAAQMGVNGGIPMPMNKDQVIAATSVASSMAGAVLSVLAPALTTGVQSVASSVFPHVSNIVMKNDLMNNNTQSKRSSKDFDVDMDDLPPFKTVSNDAGGSKG
jgi:ubiquinone biosynthesis protein COQ9